jgi:hypothetical protein
LTPRLECSGPPSRDLHISLVQDQRRSLRCAGRPLEGEQVEVPRTSSYYLFSPAPMQDVAMCVVHEVGKRGPTAIYGGFGRAWSMRERLERAHV